MGRRLAVPIIVACATVSLLAAPGQREESGQSGRPSVPKRIGVQTIDQLWALSDLVIYGRVKAVGYPTLYPGSRPPLVVRYQTVEAIEFFKTDEVKLSPSLVVIQQGGTIDTNGVLAPSDYTEQILKVNDEVVLMLMRDKNRIGYWLTPGGGVACLASIQILRSASRATTASSPSLRAASSA